jgi:hypothetical protein
LLYFFNEEIKKEKEEYKANNELFDLREVSQFEKNFTE